MIDVESYERAVELAAYVILRARPRRRAGCTSGDRRPAGHVEAPSEDSPGMSTRRSAPGRGRVARPRPARPRTWSAGAEDFDAAEDALEEAPLGGAPRAAAAPAARPVRAADDGRDAASCRRPPQRGRPAAARGNGRRDGRSRVRPPRRRRRHRLPALLLPSPRPGPASQVALTLRAVGGLTTREIADAFYVPEATMAQRISRAKRTLRGAAWTSPATSPSCRRARPRLHRPATDTGPTRPDLAARRSWLRRRSPSPTEEPRRAGCPRRCS